MILYLSFSEKQPPDYRAATTTSQGEGDLTSQAASNPGDITTAGEYRTTLGVDEPQLKHDNRSPLSATPKTKPPASEARHLCSDRDGGTQKGGPMPAF